MRACAFLFLQGELYSLIGKAWKTNVIRIGYTVAKVLYFSRIDADLGEASGQMHDCLLDPTTIRALDFIDRRLRIDHLQEECILSGFLPQRRW